MTVTLKINSNYCQYILSINEIDVLHSRVQFNRIQQLILAENKLNLHRNQ